jgi:D-sedoheptulose 7-phosphate isomerase
MEELIRNHLTKSSEVKLEVAKNCVDDISRAAILITNSLKNDGKIMLCGNGGSAADCQHISAEFASVLSQDFFRPALAAISLTTDTSFITANANDYGFEGIFERQVEALGRKGDSLIGISTSGNSKNVLRAINFAKNRGIHTIALTGISGGQMADAADVCVRVPSTNTQFIQESHIAIGHILCELAEKGLFPQQ